MFKTCLRGKGSDGKTSKQSALDGIRSSGLGFDATEAMRQFREQLHQHVLGKLWGVPRGYSGRSGSGQSIRELWRIFTFSPFRTPVGMLAAHAIGKAIGEPDLELSFEKTYAADVLSRATSFSRLVKDDKVSVEKALAMTGLLDFEMTA